MEGPWFPGTPVTGGASELAAAIAAAVGPGGMHVRGELFLRPASLRLEYGHADPDAYYSSWLDVDAVRREVLDRALRGTVLTALRDPDSDRSIRAAPHPVARTGVVVVDAAFLIGVVGSADLTVHVQVSPAALARRTPPGWEWTCAAYERHRREHRAAAAADVVLHADHPSRPAISLTTG